VLNQKQQKEHTLKMPKCSYCKRDYSFPRGLTLIRKDGTVNHLCSSKCRKNMLMKRRKVRWILKKIKDKVVEPVKEEKLVKVEEKAVEKVEKVTEKKSEKKVVVKKKK
jgi:ribosomal protein L24E